MYACHSTKPVINTTHSPDSEISVKTNTPTDNNIPPANPHELVPQGECLAQDKPFLDSLKRHLYKSMRGYEEELV